MYLLEFGNSCWKWIHRHWHSITCKTKISNKQKSGGEKLHHLLSSLNQEIPKTRTHLTFFFFYLFKLAPLLLVYTEYTLNIHKIYFSNHFFNTAQIFPPFVSGRRIHSKTFIYILILFFKWYYSISWTSFFIYSHLMVSRQSSSNLINAYSYDNYF